MRNYCYRIIQNKRHEWEVLLLEAVKSFESYLMNTAETTGIRIRQGDHPPEPVAAPPATAPPQGPPPAATTAETPKRQCVEKEEAAGTGSGVKDNQDKYDKNFSINKLKIINNVRNYYMNLYMAEKCLREETERDLSAVSMALDRAEQFLQHQESVRQDSIR